MVRSVLVGHPYPYLTLTALANWAHGPLDPMESIRQAVERARAGKNRPRAQISDNLSQPRGRIDSGPVVRPATGGPETQVIELSGDHLQSKRIVAHNGADQR